jgi:hypothetical protein
MPKSLKDVLAGIKASKIVPGSTGDEPGVDYEPKSPAEQDFVKKHSTEKHSDRVGNDDDVYQAKNIKYSLEKDNKHGHKSPNDKKVYDKKVSESAACNMTEEGSYCPVHEMSSCKSGKTLRELTRKKMNEEKHVFHVHMPAPVGRQHKMVDPENEPDVSEPVGKKPKGERLKITVPGDRRTATNKAARYVAKNYGTNVRFTYSHKVDESLAFPLLGGDSDDESAEMAKTQLKAIAAKAMQLASNLSDDEVIEPWVQSKIAVAKDKIAAVHDYLMYGDSDKNQEQTAPYAGGIDMSSAPRNTYPSFSVDVNTGRNV